MKFTPPLRLEWSKVYELGIPEIDDQHRRVVDVINDLFLARFEGRAADVKKALDQACIYVIDHLGYEEALLKRANYKKWEEHCTQHRQFTDELASCYKLYDNGVEIGEKLQTLLMSWLLVHIKREDFEFRDDVLHYLALQEEVPPSHVIKQRKSDLK